MGIAVSAESAQLNDMTAITDAALIPPNSRMAAARNAGCRNINLDLIYGWPGQGPDIWWHDLERILGAEIGGSVTDHLSLYGLIVEPGTPMADAVKRGILTPVDDDTAADFYELAVAILDEAGWLHYEIANWSSSPELASSTTVVRLPTSPAGQRRE